jgi:transcriptional regulator with XRE-family HTH domain
MTNSSRQRSGRGADDEAAFHSPLRIGPRVRVQRRLKGLTVDELARAIGVDKAHVSRIERGLKTPSIATMARLASALGVSIGHLVGETLDKSTIKITRRADLGPPPFEPREPASHGFVPLLHGASVGAFEAFLLDPGDDEGAVPAHHEGQEMLYVVTGSLEVIFSDHRERLDAGDCIHFPGYLSHRIARVGRTRSAALLVISSA